MAFFDFFRKLSFFAGRDTSGMQAEDLDFAKWVVAHRNWRLRLVNFIEGSSQEKLDEKAVCQDHLCDLGKWIHGNGARFYGDVELFKDVRSRHAVFHHCAGEVIRRYKSDGETAARKLLETEFDRASVQVVLGLEALERQVKA